MNNRIRLFFVAITFLLTTTSCSNRAAMAMSRYLISNEKYVTAEMINSVANSAEKCGFHKTDKIYRNAGTLVFYVRASDDEGNLGIGLVESDYGISIIEGDNSRGINQGFDAGSSMKLICFEQELNKLLPNMFALKTN